MSIHKFPAPSIRASRRRLYDEIKVAGEPVRLIVTLGRADVLEPAWGIAEQSAFESQPGTPQGGGQ